MAVNDQVLIMTIAIFVDEKSSPTYSSLSNVPDDPELCRVMGSALQALSSRYFEKAGQLMKQEE